MNIKKTRRKKYKELNLPYLPFKSILLCILDMKKHTLYLTMI